MSFCSGETAFQSYIGFDSFFHFLYFVMTSLGNHDNYCF